MTSPAVLIVSPYAAAANNGNVRTAERWASLLQPQYRVTVSTPADAMVDADVLIALHARRSYACVREWHTRHPTRPIVVTLTGTDLYRDVPLQDTHALASLELAYRLIVLQERGIMALPPQFRPKAHAIYQSSPPLPAFVKSTRSMRVLFVGHLREEKDPATFVRAAAELRARKELEFAIVGGMRDPALEGPLQELLAAAPNVRMLGTLPHRVARERIRRAHLLVVPSRMEGGANVIVEAIMAGTVVLASDCDGNIGMLGADYPGYFAVGDFQGLAHLIARWWADDLFRRHLHQLCRTRASLFTTEAEQRGMLGVIGSLVGGARA